MVVTVYTYFQPVFFQRVLFYSRKRQKETMTIAVLSLAVGIGIAVFTVLAVKWL